MASGEVACATASAYRSQPALSPASWMYSLLVTQEMNFHASSGWSLLAVIPSPYDHSQPDGRPECPVGAIANPIWSAIDSSA